MQKTYALFDFDGTLRPGDSIVTLCLFAYRRGLCSGKTLLCGMGAAARYGLGLLSAEKAKQAAMAWIAGRSVEEMADLSQQFCKEKLLPSLYPAGRRALEDEKKRGATVLLITASPSFYLEPLKKLLPVEDIIGTRMAVDDGGSYTGDICGDNCRGLQKPLRLAEYLAAKGDRLEYESSCAYGDSKGDLPMLELCQNRVAVNAKKSLLLAARDASPAVRRVFWTAEKERDSQ